MLSGMDDSAIENRLFDEQIKAGVILSANSIIWLVSVNNRNETSVRLQVTSSAYWLGAIRETDSFEWDAGLVAN